MEVSFDFKKIGEVLNKNLKSYNYQVAPVAPAGKPGKVVKSMREYRLQLINKQNDTSEALIGKLNNILTKLFTGIKNLKFNSVSQNSSKFPSYSFNLENNTYDIIVARGANKGENFETQTIGNISKAFNYKSNDPSFAKLINQLHKANEKFEQVEIIDVSQRKGSTKKEDVPIAKLGEVIGDIVLTDSSKNKWYVSLKDINGVTFSSYSGAASIFNKEGDIQPTSEGSQFLEAFGVDLNKVQKGFDIRNKKKTERKQIPVEKQNSSKIKKIFERAWGMNYFYVRRKVSGWEVFFIDDKKLNALTNDIKVTEIRYPSISSKQISILCQSGEKKYLIELRNSKAGEYPNDTKFKVR